jgi:hypothetical protein
MDLCRARRAGVVELHATDTGRILYERAGFVPRPGAPEMRWADPTVVSSAGQRRRAGPANTPSGS